MKDAQPAERRPRREVTIPAPWKHGSRRRWRRVLQIGCLPLTLAGSGALVLIFALFGSAPPPWVSTPRDYLIAGRIGGALAALGIIQLGLSWLLSLLGALAGAGAAGSRPGHRLRIVGRRLRVLAAAVAAVRIGLIGMGLLTVIHAYTNWLGSPVSEGILGILRLPAFKSVPAWLAGCILAVQGVIGPFLRLRYSAALGALAAALAPPRRPDRLAAALTARLGADLAGALAVIWGWAILSLAIVTLLDPYSSYTYYTYEPVNGWDLLAMVAGGAALTTAGQVALASVWLALTRRTLLNRAHRHAA